MARPAFTTFIVKQDGTVPEGSGSEYDASRRRPSCSIQIQADLHRCASFFGKVPIRRMRNVPRGTKSIPGGPNKFSSVIRRLRRHFFEAVRQRRFEQRTLRVQHYACTILILPLTARRVPLLVGTLLRFFDIVINETAS